MRGFLYGATPGDLDEVVVTCRTADYKLAIVLLEQWVRGRDSIGDAFPRPAVRRPPEAFRIERSASWVTLTATRDAYEVSQSAPSRNARWPDELDELRCVLDALGNAMDNRLGEVPSGLSPVDHMVSHIGD